MSESMVEAQNIDNKMRESVSFGKYENDSLSWEKWSTFSPNKYLDEVGKCSTPGSVAQKKAFFEAHYKKIAAMKAEAELLEQQRAAETAPSRSDDYTEEIMEEHEEIVQSKASVNDEPEVGGSEKCQNEKREEATSVKDESFQDESLITLNNNGENLEEAIPVKDESFQDKSLITLNNNGDSQEDANMIKGESFRDESIPVSKVLNINGEKLDEAVLVNDESMKLVKQHFKVDLEDPQESKQEISKPKAQNVAKKVNPTKVEKNLVVMKKKPTSLIPKSPETSSSTRLIKPKATPITPMAAIRSSSKKANATSSSLSKSSKSKNPSGSMRTAPMSLHLSMSMNSVNSDTASSVTSSRRRSLFMEQMGDKDIVKRAFKTFQNRVNQLTDFDERSSGHKQLQTKESEQKASTSMASQKENERSKKAAEKINPARGRLGTTWKSQSSGSLKGVSVDERRPKAGSSSVVLRSNERAERRKEFFKNLEEKSNAREAERTQINSKSKEAKDTEIKKLRQNLSFKAKPMPTFYKSQGVSKSTLEKEGIKNGTQRRPDSHR